MKVLIDGDILLYSCAFAAEHTHYLVELPEGGGFVNCNNHKETKEHDGIVWSRKEVQPVEFAIHATNTVLEALVSRFEPSSVDVFLSDSTTFRHHLGKTKPYKGNRTAPKPEHYDAVKDHLLSRGAIIREGYEADDCLAIEATKDPKGTILVSTDKDLMQIPGNHFNWKTLEYLVQSPKQADVSLATQLLTGDSTDNIPGLPKVGPVAAKEILSGAKNRKDLFGRVFKAYAEKIGNEWEDYFSEQFALIYLLREYGQEKIYFENPTEVAKQIGSTLQGAA